jgi:alpha-beta hydrolase superfamily lysophospholipase
VSIQQGHLTSSIDKLKIVWKAYVPETPAKAVIHVVHGYSEHFERHRSIIDKLLPAGYIVCGTDHRGHGLSEGRRGHVNSFMDFISDEKQFRREIIDQNFAGLPCFMVGHSMGSVIALRYALEYPADLKGLVLSGTGARSGRKAMTPLLRSFARLGSRFFPTLPTRFPLKPDFISHDAAVIRAYVNDPLVFKVCTPRLAEQMDSFITRNFHEAAALKMPVLIQCGTEDLAFDGQPDLALALGSHDKTFRFYEGLRHEPYNELEPARSEALNELQAWLDARL